jgi:hypothetical protein
MPAPAPSVNHYSSLVDVVTTQQFMKGEFDNTVKRNIILNKLSEKGNIKFEASGKFFERNARVGVHEAAYRAADLAARSFARKQQRVSYAVPYAVREVTGVLGELDVMFNSGKEGLVSLSKTMLKNMAEDFRKDIATLLLRSNAAGSTSMGQTAVANSPVPFFGLPTMFGPSATVLAYNADTQVVGGGIAATDREACPNVTYCGVSTHPTNPIAGVDDKANEATSPVLGNWSSTAWTGTATWLSTGFKVIDHMLTRLQRSADSTDSADIVLLTRSMWNDLRGALQTNFRIELSGQPKSVAPTLYRDNVIPWGGAEACWDVSQPANIAFFLNSNHLELTLFPQKNINRDGTLEDAGDQMFSVKTEYSIEQGGHLAVAQIAGQLWGNPFYHGAAQNFA